ncbi:MAG: hypothetical protein IPJ38_15100 [Dechloromonas sp.]|uniref:Uncharacterized protein n=1 Tax=Candidatus Dechloromonas phosphorivorans TaxID=2899244 RepID=A0A935N268_9RHOO|nr:hypothetical protein [Candidatus Dechloromonas phosphorivorans]
MKAIAEADNALERSTAQCIFGPISIARRFDSEAVNKILTNININNIKPNIPLSPKTSKYALCAARKFTGE